MDKILSEYLIARESDGKTSHPIAHFITKDFTQDLKDYFGEEDTYIVASAGRGALARVPWAAITANKI